MRRIIFAAPWVALAYGARMPESQAYTPVSQCVQVEPEPAERGISLRVHNTCEYAVRCALTWRVRCDGDPPDATSRDMRVDVRLAPAANKQLLASGEACGERIWEITDDVWDCKEVR